MVRIFIYDDHLDRRESLKALISLDANYLFVGEDENCANVKVQMNQTTPDLVLMDINMPDVDGLQGLKIIKSNFPQIKVLVQTAYDDDEKIFNSIKYGASGYILKSDKAQKILQSIDEVLQGGAVMNPAIAAKVLNYFKPQNNPIKLTEKEIEVLGFLAEGYSYKMVADKMGVSYSTVNTHTKRMYEKLHISSLGEAIAYYYKNIK